MILHQIPIEKANRGHCSTIEGFLGTATKEGCTAKFGCIRIDRKNASFHHACFRQGLSEATDIKYCECARRKEDIYSYYLYGKMVGVICQECSSGKC